MPKLTMSSPKAYGCLPGIHKEVLSAVDTLLRAAAVEADNFIQQATENLKEAKNYYRKATKNEEFYRQKLADEQTLLDKRIREVWLAEQRYNSSCEEKECAKSTLLPLFNWYMDEYIIWCIDKINSALSIWADSNGLAVM